MSETAGYRSGLAVDEPRLRGFLADGGYADFWPTEQQMMRVRSEVFEELHWIVLRSVGVEADEYDPYPLATYRRKLEGDQKRLRVFDALSDPLLDYLRAPLLYEESEMPDVASFVLAAETAHGKMGGEVAAALMKAIDTSQRNDLWNPSRRRTWADTRELAELFESERLVSPHGTYFDERFANFLAVNFHEIDCIKWRQFEGLAAEYFKREGFRVELGPGRGDGGVDIRLWPSDDAVPGAPAAVLVQCKRQRAKISNTVVKALWADVEAEAAASGMIVTTSSLSPSAERVRTARNYAIEAVERDRLASWLAQMRTPGTGFFLGQ